MTDKPESRVSPHHSQPRLHSAHLRVTALALTLLFTACHRGKKVEGPRGDDYLAKPYTAQNYDPRRAPLKPGESVDVYVLEDPTFNGVYAVRNEGHIIFPSMGRVVLAGLTPPEAEAQLKKLLQGSKLRTATVILDRVSQVGSPLSVTSEQLRVYLTGKVASPGARTLNVELGKTMGVYEAILIAGGLSRFANEEKSYVLRDDNSGGPKRKIGINLKAVASGAARDLPLKQGDVVFVPEKIFGF